MNIFTINSYQPKRSYKRYNNKEKLELINLA